MKTIDPAFQARLAQDRLTLCSAVKLTRQDGLIVYLTDNVSPIKIAGNPYEPKSMVQGSDVETRGALSVDNMEVEMAFDSPSITRDDMIKGRWDFAAYTVYLVDYDAVDGSGDNYHSEISAGWLGEISFQQISATVEWRSMTQALQQRIGQVLSPDCRADLGDPRCTVALAPWTATGALTSITSATKFRDSNQTAPPGPLQYGTLTFTTGAANEGQVLEVKSFATGGYFEITQPFRKSPEVGDPYTTYAGCNKSDAACKGFSNILNMQAELFLIGSDELAKFGRQ